MISMDKKYITQSGNPVRLLCVDRISSNQKHSVIYLARVGNLDMIFECDSDGVNLLFPTHSLIEVKPYDDFKKDDPVMVREYNGCWRRRYFSHTNLSGTIFCFNDGRTSWSSNNVTVWDEMRRPTEFELGETK